MAKKNKVKFENKPKWCEECFCYVCLLCLKNDSFPGICWKASICIIMQHQVRNYKSKKKIKVNEIWNSKFRIYRRGSSAARSHSPSKSESQGNKDLQFVRGELQHMFRCFIIFFCSLCKRTAKALRSRSSLHRRFTRNVIVLCCFVVSDDLMMIFWIFICFIVSKCNTLTIYKFEKKNKTELCLFQWSTN